MDAPRITIIEDNDAMRLGMSEALRRDGGEVAAFRDARDALAELARRPADLVITDLKMAPLDGLAVLDAVRRDHPDTEVILVSAFGTVEVAVDAMRKGAFDFLTKPFSMEELRIRTGRAWAHLRQRREMDRLRDRQRLLEADLSDELVGQSPPMQALYGLIRRIAAEESTVLISGESGTGKELVARAIHRTGPRGDEPFIRVNCGALNDNLLESELFGHEKGAFTGAVRRKKGRFELADGGTLFLDEIGDISPAMQVRLLRVLQEGEFERVGGEETLRVDVRIIAATHRDLTREAAAGRFREDLFYRLSVIPVRLPPLRERREDIPALVAHFLERRRRPGPERGIDAEGMALLQAYSWPGNIRELENLVERLLVISPEAIVPAARVAAQLGGAPVRSGAELETLPLEEALYAFEKRLIEHALRQSGGVKRQAARLLGINSSSLYYKLEKFGLLDDGGDR